MVFEEHRLPISSRVKVWCLVMLLPPKKGKRTTEQGVERYAVSCFFAPASLHRVSLLGGSLSRGFEWLF